MGNTRTLALRKETLAQLSAEDLTAVNGMSGPGCFTLTCGGPCHSDLVKCMTGTGCISVTGC